MYTTMELEQTKLVAQEELRKRDEQLIHLEEVLTKTLKERDEALEKCHHLIFNNLLLQQKQTTQQQKYISPPLSGASSIEDEQQLQPQQQQQQQQEQKLNSNKSFSSSDTEESIMSPSVIDPVMMNQTSQIEASGTEIMATLLLEKPLPEKGKLLQAVLKAGPLLQTLLLAGPLPQWRHPPPPLETSEIPPVTALPPQFQNNGCGNSNKKRAFSVSDGSFSETKYQKVLLH